MIQRERSCTFFSIVHISHYNTREIEKKKETHFYTYVEVHSYMTIDLSVVDILFGQL